MVHMLDQEVGAIRLLQQERGFMQQPSIENVQGQESSGWSGHLGVGFLQAAHLRVQASHLVLHRLEGGIGIIQLAVCGSQLSPLGLHLSHDIEILHDVDGPITQPSSCLGLVCDDLPAIGKRKVSSCRWLLMVYQLGAWGTVEAHAAAMCVIKLACPAVTARSMLYVVDLVSSETETQKEHDV